MVIAPMESIVASVRRMAKDPFDVNPERLKANKKDRDKKFELGMLDATITKIGNLLRVGFGAAGTQIIKNCLQGDEIQVITKGKNCVAIFGFCDIRNFTDVTECLQEGVMEYVNRVAAVVHDLAIRFMGFPNKNIGDAFLFAWPLPKTKYYNQIDGFKSAKSSGANNVSEVSVIAENALASFCMMIVEIDRNADLAAYSHNRAILRRMKDYKVTLGYGLHVGWAIEGAIGSEHKIDASYLSPNVNTSARLESATKMYGVPILVSHDVVLLLRDSVARKCRPVDKVTVKGSQQPMTLYTFDLTTTPPDFATQAAAHTMDLRLQAMNPQNQMAGGDLSVFDSNLDLRTLQHHIPAGFRTAWDEGFQCYLSGDWQTAKSQIGAALELMPGDRPGERILEYISRTDFQAPADWEGFRRLDEK